MVPPRDFRRRMFRQADAGSSDRHIHVQRSTRALARCACVGGSYGLKLRKKTNPTATELQNAHQLTGYLSFAFNVYTWVERRAIKRCTTNRSHCRKKQETRERPQPLHCTAVVPTWTRYPTLGTVSAPTLPW